MHALLCVPSLQASSLAAGRGEYGQALARPHLLSLFKLSMILTSCNHRAELYAEAWDE